MRKLGFLVPFGLLLACRVPDKQPLIGDAGTDSGGDAGWTGAVDTMITSAPGEFSNSGQAQFEFTSNAPGATFVCDIDGDTPEKCTSPYVRSLADGAHTFTVRAVLGDTEDDTPAEAVWTIDTIAPDTTITQGPPAADNSANVMFFFQSNEMNVTFDCSLDAADYKPCMTGDSFGPLGDGAHSFAVRAHDRAGNIDASPAIRAWTTDTSTPDTQILSGPMNASASQNAQFTFDSPNAGPGATFECALDSPVFVACVTPDNLVNLSEGSHTFQVRVRSSVGTVDPSPATRTWVVDLTPPDTTITGGPTGTVAATSAAFMFTSNEMNVTYTCSFDGGAMAACTSPYTAMNLTQGAHTFAVAAIDQVGHTDPTPATRMFTVDTAPPDIQFQSGPANGGTSGPRVTFAFTTSEGQPTCSVDNGAFAACTSPVSMNLSAGNHSFAVHAADAAGNMTTATRAWTVACAAPDGTGAAGLLHLDTADQSQANATGGAAATLGDTAMAEPSDPTFVAAARFGGGFGFANGQHISWPTMLGPTNAFTFELWNKPDAGGGATTLLTSGDGRVTLAVQGQGPNQVHYLIGVPGGVIQSAPVAAGAWHHVVASYGAPSLRLWVDGVRVEADNVMQGGMPPSFDALTVGGNTSGVIDEVWVSQSATTTDDAALAGYCPL
jgi:hypothetical protein